MSARTLDQWLAYQLRVHPHEIELGLERVREVWQRMGAPRAPVNLIVGGTNGKGSTVAFLVAMLRAAGHRVGAYTSPHLLRYNERVHIDGEDADDASLCDAFERIEKARLDTELTYFEFGTLAALDLFARAGVNVAVIEVGLGGRLDASNIVDADAGIVTTVDLDHQAWLGSDRDTIGVEKAGIARADRPLIIGESDPPRGLLDALQRIGAAVQRAGVDYHVRQHESGWTWMHRDGTRLELPDAVLDAPAQVANAAAAVAALHALQDRMDCPASALAEGVRTARLQGRLQRFPGTPERVLDVAHNPQAARMLASWLDEHPVRGPIHAVFGALEDKDVAGICSALAGRITHWHLAGLESESPRGLPARSLAFGFPDSTPYTLHTDVLSALDAAEWAVPQRILIFGSFFVVAAVLRSMNGSVHGIP
ncbi:bifunctional tetrahydrofolate synthase/dihydrofolate synthase [Oleiagrimonas sp.]|jgi:dihydrofolate synthase/folylpolyglutamate synthase|uniref:bifunctional tetrahydrofolate synthase/dihydrofolate synthase n=1 Tax=Oleiagrimonas sp. TaxID=2010330 RepID=UPI00262F8095|nr:bifunctional tetrahydrofolate synthase/dihydrofolate synthase [Oleiagrimonas sp.]MDA3912684.1 bifunctional tetrahydrofolate synthase/dihydrofolate synthase [Oleiagrimonas sp.]